MDHITRAGLLHKACKAHRMDKQDRYVATQVKRYGPVFREAVQIAAPLIRPDRCTAALIDLVDQELSNRHGWQSISDWRKEGLKNCEKSST